MEIFRVLPLPRLKFFVSVIECAVARGTQGRTIFNHVKIVLRKIVRTLPANFKALLNHFAASHSYSRTKNFILTPYIASPEKFTTCY